MLLRIAQAPVRDSGQRKASELQTRFEAATYGALHDIVTYDGNRKFDNIYLII